MLTKNNNIKKYILGIIIIIIIVYYVSLEINPYKYNKLTLEDIRNHDNLTLFSDRFDLFYLYYDNTQSMLNSNTSENWLITQIFPKSELEEMYNKIRNDQKSVVINPIFTASAYHSNGFYDYYGGNCDEACLTVTIRDNATSAYTSSHVGLQVLKFLQYDILNDSEIHMNPNILNNYDKIIVLHNEYVTMKMFNAFENHPNVVYLYPNALYAEVNYNEIKNTITLIRGHGYPNSNITNGFNWENENTHPYEFDNKCENWQFYEINNGWMLNCYPERFIMNSFELLEALKDL